MSSLICSSESSRYFAGLLSKRLGIGIQEIEREEFRGGEQYRRVIISSRTELFGKDVIYVASTHADAEIDDLYRIGCMLSKSGTRRRIFVIPFFGYGAMERAVKAGEVVTAKTIARLFSAIPGAANNIFLMLDLHVSGLVHYFEGDCMAFELYGENVLAAGIEELGLGEKFVMGSADLSRGKWIDAYARRFKAGLAFVRKTRNGQKTETHEVIGNVSGMPVLIYDDFSRTSGTMVDGSKAYKAHGATVTYGALSHFASADGNAAGLLLHGGHFETIVTTNSHPATQADWLRHNKRLKVMDVSPIFADAIRQILG